MVSAPPKIAVCVCTFRRPEPVRRLLAALEGQETAGLFSYSVIVVDNDVAESSRDVVQRAQETSNVQICYYIEPEQNIALARNKAVAHSIGEFIAFIDDDEVPDKDWLLCLLRTCLEYNADGVLGPVIPRYEETPPAWVERGRFCHRPRHPTGFWIDADEGRTGNLLLRHSTLDGLNPVFRPAFGSGGEDRDLFRRLIADGRKFVWCNEAQAFECLPPARWKRSVMLRRALLRGKMASVRGCGFADITKSCLAVVGYTAALPVLLIMGHHVFMKYLIKTFDHAGKVLAAVGLDPIKDKYVLE